MNKLLLIVGTFAFIASVSANIALMNANKRVVAQTETYRAQLTTPKGIALPALRGIDLNGKPAIVNLQNSNQPTALFIFSPTCAVCTRNWPDWTKLTSAKERTWRPVFVNMGSPATSEYKQTHALNNFTAIEDVSRETALTFRFFYTPETIVLDRKGRVLRTWIGQLSAEDNAAFSQTLLTAN